MLVYSDVPKDVRDNLRYRSAVLKLGDENELARPAILQASKDDFLWWLNTFCWLFEPRPDVDASASIEGKVRPFVSWPHQDEAFHLMERHWGRDDIGIIKSRAEGTSWLILMMMLHKWRFCEMEAYGLVSRTELAVDNPRDPNSLLWKLEWALKKLPKWMVDFDKDVDRNKSEHSLLYKPNGSTIVGNSATGDVARGGRATVFLMDEFAAFKQPDDSRALDSTRDVTNCRIFLSTPQGPIGAYYEIMRNPGNMQRISLWWHQNPTKNRGLYKVDKGVVSLIDYEYWMEVSGLQSKEDCDSYASSVEHLDADNVFKYGFMTQGEFVKDGALRSPWYDRQCQRPGTTPRSIAQELDGDFGGSMTRFFDVQKLDALADKCKPPMFLGDVQFDCHDVKSTKVLDGGRGYFRVWSSFLIGNRIPLREHDYTIGADIAAGSAGHDGSNSVLSICDRTTSRICAEYSAPNIAPHELAELAHCLGHFYRGPSGLPVIIPEINGVGNIFLDRLREIGYPNIYERVAEDRRTRKKMKKLGFHSGKQTKAVLLGEFRRALESGDLTCESIACLEEAKQYMLLANGKIEHVGSASSEDPSGAGENHGDRVIATACAWKAAVELGANRRSASEERRVASKSVLTIAGRMAARERAVQKNNDSRW